MQLAVTQATEATLWEPWQKDKNPEIERVHCFLCAHHCRLGVEEVGICGVRQNIKGELNTLVYGAAVAAVVDPIEKKPLYHFMPGTFTYSIATVGCNFHCSFCQNSSISQRLRESGGVNEPIPGRYLSPGSVVEAAIVRRCKSISYTYTEPTIFYEYARDTARIATLTGLKNIFVTNGYMTEQLLDDIGSDLHAANVDLKAFSDDFYRKMTGGRLKPVLDTIRRMWEREIHVEVTTLLIPTYNDSVEELKKIASFLTSVSPEIPWHVSRFSPNYKLLDVPQTPVDSVEKALEIGREEGLQYAYGGNMPPDWRTQNMGE